MVNDIPEYVKIGPYRYDVEYHDRIVYTGQDRCGESDHEEHMIRLLDSSPPSAQWEYFWHEVLHALDAMMLDHALKENEIRQLGIALSGFMLDNGFVDVHEETAEERQERLAKQRKLTALRDRGTLAP